MPPSKPAYDVDWIFSNNSNVHVANHRDWFTSYTPFPTWFGTLGVGSGADVAGVGDVELPTKTHPTRAGAAYQGSLILRNVLYAPSALCNILGRPIMDDYKCSIYLGGPTSKITANGACIGLLDRTKLWRLRLRGQSATQTSLDPEGLYAIHASWDASEAARWEAFRSRGNSQAKGNHTETTTSESPSLTQAEKQWLKNDYRDEFHFLRCHGLSIYKDEDRDEGRRILRALMQHDSIGSSGSSTESLDLFQRDLEQDPSSHAADYHFSAEELDFIEEEYGHSGNFLRCYGLKFYDDDDCRQGKAIVHDMLLEDMPPLVDIH
ncbi:MAG: hypothetical protein L6R39_002778 [Caloplaca ligustica]|nr:MAG: hypothetical protein L6R39_002778 [Caloplaca ligustica]